MLLKLSKQVYSQSITPKYFMSIWKEIKEGPADPVLGVADSFNKDTHPKKINLSVGAYRDENGKPIVMASIKKAEQLVVNSNPGHEYLPTDGMASFISHSQKLAFGNQLYDKIKPRLTGLQALSGTGSLRIATDFIKRFGNSQTVYYGEPTWPNHNNIIRDSGLNQATYTWYDPSTKLANFKKAFEDINKLPEGSYVLLHACAHNPTGCDLNPQQWQELAKVFQQKKLFAFFDMAYQGFTSGNVDTDAFAVRHFAEQNIPLLLCQSYAKNMGLYGQRIGCVSFLFNDEKTAQAAVSQVKIIARPIWSSPPLHGARIVEKVLSTPELYKEWLQDVKHVAQRIAKMRTAIVTNLKNSGSKCNWDHIAQQQGMFAYTGLKPHQCERLTNEFHVYLLKSGRISVAGVNDHNVEYLSKSIHEVTKNDGI